jgi:phytoene synthase
LGAVLATGRDLMVSRIRLAWWRESLERLDREPAPGEPVLRALAAYVLPRGVSGAELAAMEEGWAELLADAALSEAMLRTYAGARGGILFRLSARLLGAEQEEVAGEAGARWALVDLARRSADPAEARAALEFARAIGGGAGLTGRRGPLAMLAFLAKRDIERGADRRERQGSPARMARTIAFRLIGR